jgi:hypothetical protein
MKQPLNSLLTIAALVAASATFAEDVTEGIFPSVTPTCAVDPTTCIEGYVTRPDITVRMRLGKGDFDHRLFPKLGYEIFRGGFA